MMTTVETVRVELGARAYDILIGPGLIDRAGIEIAARFPKARCAIVTDENLAGLHLPRLVAALDAAGIQSVPVVLPAGEATKSFAHFEATVEAVLAARLERGDLIVAFGGGVIGDLSGFVAGVVRRGMGFVQIPTTLLSQVDSSVGGKTGINSPHGKNLIGVFNQPGLVLADSAILDTLSPREFRAGYAEVAKYGLIDDPALFAWLEANWPAIFAGGPQRIEAIAAGCRAKARVVAMDETETGPRALLNLGHTFGHALEQATHYDSRRLVHGEGVAIGMCLAYEFSAHMNLASPDDAARVAAHLKAVGLPTRLQDVPGDLGGVDGLMQAIGQDKKVKRGALTFILTHGIGKSYIANDVPPAAVRDFLARKLAG